MSFFEWLNYQAAHHVSRSDRLLALREREVRAIEQMAINLSTSAVNANEKSQSRLDRSAT